VPKENEALIRIEAAGVNFVDTLYVRFPRSLHLPTHELCSNIHQAKGKHQNNRTLVRPPFILGLEYAGTVLSSPRNSPFPPGTRVFGGSLGSYAELVAAPVASLRRVPSGWPLAGAAGLAATLAVAYGALAVRGGARLGENVLVLGAAGGLGCMAVQVAAALGCRVVAVAAGAAKRKVALRCGAWAAVDYGEGTGKWWEEVMRLTDGKGVDVVFDPVGMVNESLKCLAHRGRVIIVGFAARDEKSLESVAMNRVLLKQATLIGYVSAVLYANFSVDSADWLLLAVW
jgi:NADPH:quinone reductase